MLMPEMAIAQSVASAVLPTFSAQSARGQFDQIRSSLSSTLRGVLLLAIPASLGLVLLNRPLVQLLYERGNFTPEDTTLVSWTLLWYAAGLVGHCLVEVLARTFYALQDTRTPVLVGTLAMGLNIALSLVFSRLFAAGGWEPVGGLALANTLATALEAAILVILVRARLNGLEGRHLLQGVGAALLAGSAMALVLWFWRAWLEESSADLTALGGVVVGSGIYLAGMLVLKVPELGSLLAMIRRRLRKV
jgi:putative peptidoglycan lipid II flippase